MTTGLKNYLVTFFLVTIFLLPISNPANAAATSTSRIIYHHTDHLGGITVSTDKDGKVIETTDYLPYGEQKFRYSVQPQNEQRKYAGYERDPSTNLDYLNSRYYNNKSAKFLSQDPAFWLIGQEEKIRATTGQNQQDILSDPQLLNSYSYGRGNPLIFKDSNGEIFESPADIAFIGYDLYKLKQAFQAGDTAQIKAELQNLEFDLAALAIPGVTGLGLVNRGKQTLQIADQAKDVAQALKNHLNQIKRLISNLKNIAGIKALNELLKSTGELKKVKGALQGIVKGGDAKKVFTDLSQQLQANIGTDKKGNPFFESGNVRFTLYKSSTQSSDGRLPTIQVNVEGVRIFKIRFTQ